MEKFTKILLMAALLCGCYTEKKAQKQVDKAVNKKPKIAAETLRKAFPCITKIDTVVKIDTGYDFIEIQCPDQAQPGTKIDTIYINKKTTQKVYLPGKITKVAAQKETITITKYIKDSAEIYLLQQAIKDGEFTNSKLRKKLDKRNNLIISLLVALLLSITVNVLQWKRN
jgi:hypothetical protein